MSIFVLSLSILTLAAAFGVVLCRNAMHSALCLVLTFLLMAVHYAILQAHFIAVLQVMIYAGAIMVLVVFVIMLIGVAPTSGRLRGRKIVLPTALIALCCSGLFVALYEFCRGSNSSTELSVLSPDFGTVSQLGMLLFTRYIYPFELISLLILGAIIGSVVLAQEPKRKLPAGRGLQAMQDGAKGRK